MRYKFAEIIEAVAKKDKKIVFMTGDLGFHAFEKLRNNLGRRFINAGVAEHNMVTAAAGMAYAGLKPWIYSIAPFVSIKVLEEIRNDICLPNFNVKIVALGGGYDYGIAGPTHHALSDIAAIMTLPNIKIYTPGIGGDMPELVTRIYNERGPAYLRLTKAESVDIKLSSYAPVRRLLKGEKITVVVLGSMVNRVIPACLRFKSKPIDVWMISELPFELPKGLIESIKKTQLVCVVEEHVNTGGLGHYFQHLLFQNRVPLKNFIHLYAKGYVSKKYGSRDFYLKESGLDEENIVKTLSSLVKT
ncbi:transketolase [Candidatus Roizmanbacteria bacterium]|nr:transketolase [Candidatus Roizmanbacteria bacterium]